MVWKNLNDGIKSEFKILFITKKCMKSNSLKMLSKVLMLLTVFMVVSSCGSDDDEDDLIGNWIERSVFDGTPRSSAAYFTIGNIGYVGTGFDGDDYLKDFWSYDMDGNYWVQLADFPGVERSSAVGFSIAENGYIGTGYYGDSNLELSDFYKYNPTSGSWSTIADFGGSARRSAIGFGSDQAGYVGTGYDGQNDRKDFWKYSPDSDSWEQVLGFGGGKRRDATSFTINNKAFVFSGVSNGANESDMWAFDFDSETWTSKNNLYIEDEYNIVRNNAVGFSFAGKGYLACGNVSGYVAKSVWEYDPGTDFWTQKSHLEGVSRQGAIAFYNDSRAFVGLGRSGTLYLDDIYELFPNSESNDDD